MTPKALLLAALMLAGAAQAQIVRLQTSMGEIKIELDAQKAPKTVANFLAYAKAGHYNGTIFHRVIPDFMVQAGGFTPALVQKATKPPIPLESGNGLINGRGSVAMARSGHPDSATSQFFINVTDNAFLDKGMAADGMGYAVFGHVVEGLEVVDKIRALPTENKGMHSNVPVKPVVINKVIVETRKK